MKFKKMLSLLLSAAMFFAPAVSMAEEALPSYFAGELSATAISDSYAAGNQINLNVDFGVDAAMPFENERLQAALNLLSEAVLSMSCYKDAGMDRIHAELTTDGASLMTADMLILEDGSVQIMSNLTGQLVLALPAGTLVDGQVDLSVLSREYNFNFETDVGLAAFKALPAKDRLRIMLNDVFSMLINHLLGWVSYAQMDTDGELYVFDDTYLDATETRDPVAQRMIGTIQAHQFTTLPHNITMTLCDDYGELQQAIADVLAERGVTRYQVRQVVDALLTKEKIDPALDWVQPSHAIPDDGELCRYDDISYFFKKLVKSTLSIWENSTENTLSMDVSYDDFGSMVGFDADLQRFTTVLPYEGTFTYSVKSDDNWQQMHTANGELKIDEENHVIGQLSIHNGEDVDCVNKNHLIGHADVVNQQTGDSKGFGVNANLDYTVGLNEDGSESELFEGAAILNLRDNQAEKPFAALTMSGMTTVDAAAFGLSATSALEITDKVTVIADATLEQAEREEIPFAGGQAIDLVNLDEKAIERIKSEVKMQAAKLGVSLVVKPDVLANLLKLMGE